MLLYGGAPAGIESSSLDYCPDLPADFKQFTQSCIMALVFTSVVPWVHRD